MDSVAREAIKKELKKVRADIGKKEDAQRRLGRDIENLRDQEKRLDKSLED